jgi:hypothetical protein
MKAGRPMLDFDQITPTLAFSSALLALLVIAKVAV